MEQLYLVVVDRRKNELGMNEFTDFYTISKIKVAEYLTDNERSDKCKSRAWTFPELKEITSADINLLTV